MDLNQFLGQTARIGKFTFVITSVSHRHQACSRLPDKLVFEMDGYENIHVDIHPREVLEAQPALPGEKLALTSSTIIEIGDGSQ